MKNKKLSRYEQLMFNGRIGKVTLQHTGENMSLLTKLWIGRTNRDD